MAAKYSLEGLQELAKAEFRKSKFEDTIKYQRKELERVSQNNTEFLLQLKEAIEVVFMGKYGDTKGLRQVAAELTSKCAGKGSLVTINMEEGGWVDSLPGLGLEMVRLQKAAEERRRRG